MTFSSTAPTHPHATGVAVYPALFLLQPSEPDFTVLALENHVGQEDAMVGVQISRIEERSYISAF